MKCTGYKANKAKKGKKGTETPTIKKIVSPKTKSKMFI
jgi:hypothetical protein